LLSAVILSVAAPPKRLGKLTWEEGSREGAKKAKKAQKGPKTYNVPKNKNVPCIKSPKHRHPKSIKGQKRVKRPKKGEKA